MKKIAIITIVVALVASAATVIAVERWLIAAWEESSATALDALDSADAPADDYGSQDDPDGIRTELRQDIAEQTAALHKSLPAQMWGGLFPVLSLYSALVLLVGCGWLSWWQKWSTER